jgi:hypothetical protein
MKPHRLAEYFPLLEGDEFEQLKQDIAENGQLEPIVVYENQILDGVNRYRACLEVGVLPDTVDFNGGDPMKFVVSKNVRRRHLNESQRALLATEMLPELEERNRPGPKSVPDGSDLLDRPSSKYAADVFGIGRTSVTRAKRIKEQAPERVPEIMSGKTSVYQVESELKEAKARERAQARAKDTNKKERQENPHEVKEYIDAMIAYEKAIKLGLKVADYGKFSPEAAQYVINRHNKIRNILLGFDDILESIE